MIKSMRHALRPSKVQELDVVTVAAFYKYDGKNIAQNWFLIVYTPTYVLLETNFHHHSYLIPQNCPANLVYRKAMTVSVLKK